MGFDANIEFLRIAFWQIIITAGPLLGVALAIGLLVGIIQAATSINEMTLSFVPKLVVVIMTFGLLSTFMLTQLSDFFMFTFDQIAQVGGGSHAWDGDITGDADAGSGPATADDPVAPVSSRQPARWRVPAVRTIVRCALAAIAGADHHGIQHGRSRG